MSYLVARMQKMKAGNLGGAYKHNERIFSNHSNKDIDTSRSHLNYELTDRDRSVSYEKQIKSYIEENKTSKRATRSDAVLCDEWIVTSDSQFFERLDSQETREFFETAKDFFAERYGLENIAYASVHLDEKTPHMHLGIVPMRHGKLSSKAMFDREELKDIQAELPRYMASHGFDLERGQLGSERKHLSVADYKAKIGEDELNQELLDLGAPKYWHIEEDRPATKDEGEDYEGIGSLFSDEVFKIREATLEERFKWLDSHRNNLRADLSYLDEVVEKKYEEIDRIDFKASESRSKLIELDSKVKTRKQELKGVKDDLGRSEGKLGVLKSENKQLENKLRQRAKRLQRYSVVDTFNRLEVQSLREELMAAVPRKLVGGFVFENEFVERLRGFVNGVVDKLEQALSEAMMWKDTARQLADEVIQLKKRRDYLTRTGRELEDENQILKQENKDLKRSEELLGEVWEVLTDKERVSVSDRLERRREAQKASERVWWQEQEPKGPSL